MDFGPTSVMAGLGVMSRGEVSRMRSWGHKKGLAIWGKVVQSIWLSLWCCGMWTELDSGKAGSILSDSRACRLHWCRTSHQLLPNISRSCAPFKENHPLTFCITIYFGINESGNHWLELSLSPVILFFTQGITALSTWLRFWPQSPFSAYQNWRYLRDKSVYSFELFLK